jgi:hypothetical protein
MLAKRTFVNKEPLRGTLNRPPHLRANSGIFDARSHAAQLEGVAKLMKIEASVGAVYDRAFFLESMFRRPVHRAPTFGGNEADLGGFATRGNNRARSGGDHPGTAVA